MVTQTPEDCKKLCDRTIWLDNGDIRMMGESEEVCDAYTKYMLGE